MRYQRRTPRTAATAVFAALAVFTVTACDDDSPTTPGDDQGTMEAVVRDGSTAQAFGMGNTAAQTSGEVEGEFEAQVQVQVQVDGTWQDVSGMSNLHAHTELQGGQSTMGSANVEARTYDRVRVIVSNASADVEAGSNLGVGPIEVDVSVVIAGGSNVVVEYTQPITVQAGATTQLVLDVNSQGWLTSDAVEAGAATEAAFRSAATVLVQ